MPTVSAPLEWWGPRRSEMPLTEQFRHVEPDVRGRRSARTLVGLAGTVCALACYDLGLESCDHDAVHHYRLSRPAAERALAVFASRPAAQRALLPGIEPARAPVIVGGSLVLVTFDAAFRFRRVPGARVGHPGRPHYHAHSA